MKKLRIAYLLGLLIAAPSVVFAHPMGNFSISHHSTIHVSARSISVRTIFDFAEIATFQIFPDPRKATDSTNEWMRHLHLQADGKTLPLQLQNVRADIIPATTGLPTLRVEIRANAAWNAGDAVLHFKDENYPNRIGWKEIVIEADPELNFPDGNPYKSDQSHALTVFPENLLSSAPAVVSAKV